MQIKSIVFVILLFFCFLKLVQADTLTLPTYGYQKVERVDYLEDTSGLAIAEVVDLMDNNSFKNSVNTPINILPNKKVFWLHFKVYNNSNSDNEWLLNFDKWTYVTFYSKQGATFYSKKTGHLVPFNDRDYGLANSNLILLPVKKQSYSECFVRLEFSNNTIFLPADLSFTIYDKDYFLKKEIDNRFLLGLFLGTFLILIAYNFFIYLSIKDESYIYYLLFLLASAYGIVHNSGYTYQILRSWDIYALNFSFIDIFASSFMVIPFTLLVKLFLRTKINFPLWDKILTFFLILFIVFPFLPLLMPVNDVFQIQSLCIIIFTIFSLLISFLAYRKRIPSANYFFFANLFLLSFTIIFMLKELQVLPLNDFTNHAYTMGTVIQATLFSLAFANRINVLRSENEQKQTEIIKHLEEKEQVLEAWKEALINTEKLQRESLSFQFESLKNQVNPHFLFNSLNVLIGLLYKSQEDATKFVKQLAQIYRYVLKNKNKEVVDLVEELEFIEAFIYLLRIRFSSNLEIINNINSSEGLTIPPLTLQMLIENAIKHNSFNEQKPLRINLDQEEEYIVISNNIQLKEKPEEISGIGLNNLRNRYKFLTEKEIIISNESGTFTVKVPVVITE